MLGVFLFIKLSVFSSLQFGWSDTTATCQSLQLPASLFVERKANSTEPVYLLIGFAKSGHLAWIERARSVDGPEFWRLQVQNLDQDKKDLTVDLWPEEDQEITAANFCKAFSDSIDKSLAKFAIQPAKSLVPVPAGAQSAIAEVEIQKGTKDQNSQTLHTMIMKTTKGQKTLGTVRQVDPDTGQDPISAPKLVGLLKSPFEQRVAVLFYQETQGAEATTNCALQVFGSRLDKGWTPARSH